MSWVSPTFSYNEFKCCSIACKTALNYLCRHEEKPAQPRTRSLCSPLASSHERRWAQSLCNPLGRLFQFTLLGRRHHCPRGSKLDVWRVHAQARQAQGTQRSTEHQSTRFAVWSTTSGSCCERNPTERRNGHGRHGDAQAVFATSTRAQAHGQAMGAHVIVVDPGLHDVASNTLREFRW